ncbi:1-acyl-sn-glycerol-3-phosphate acyltransferase beta-like [Maniola jurtina]|uniref:1-acyl-sn-glycerol-3-phosphate acyltransferase beta-like n=1 Tax=Maniola jurtina TaxID=191418 RepID=UPI001E68DD36|nr:1-acyl-sn-glycerol-3-phosphate acyltransferase beta-like [Maniola jurtina]
MWDVHVYIFYSLVVYLIWKFVLCELPDYVIYYAKFGFYIVSSQIVSAVLLPYLAIRPRDLRNGNLMARIMQHVSKVLGVKWEHRNEKILLEETGAIVVANHQSALDILGMFSVCHVAPKTAPVCKKEILYLFPFGLAAYLNGCIFIDRRNPEAARNILKAEADILFKNMSKIWMYPEGTRNKTCDKLQPFKKGAFNLAIACQAPIIPVVTSPYYFLDGEKRIFNNGRAIIQCLEPVPTKGLTMDDLPELLDRVHKMMEVTYLELGNEVACLAAN